MTTPKLTILIPTYKRSLYVSTLIHRFAELISKAGANEIELLVTDNRSDDETAEIVAAFAAQYPFIRYHCHERHYPTGEENLLHAMPIASGEFVWPFSDDDWPEAEAVSRVLSYINSRQYDYILLNARYRSGDGAIIVDKLISDTPQYVEYSMRQIVAYHGMMHMAACFSTSVYRRELLLKVDWQKYVAISPIYSHVAIYLDAFRATKCLFVSEPMVQYYFGADFAEGGHDKFRRLAARQGTYFRYFWSLGLIRLLKLAEERNAIEPGFFHSIKEITHTASFALADHTLEVICDQLLDWLSSREDSDQITPEEMKEVAVAFTRGDQRFVTLLNQLNDVVLVVRDIWAGNGTDGTPQGAIGDLFSRLGVSERNNIIGIVESWAKEVVRDVKARCYRTTRSLRRVGDHGGYKIYASGPHFMAVSPHAAAARPELYTDSFPPDILLASTVDSLTAKIGTLQQRGDKPPATGDQAIRRRA